MYKMVQPGKTVNKAPDTTDEVLSPEEVKMLRTSEREYAQVDWVLLAGRAACRHVIGWPQDYEQYGCTSSSGLLHQEYTMLNDEALMNGG